MRRPAPAAGNLILIGCVGTGKATLGVRAARQLGLEYLSTDREAEKLAGESVSEIFRDQGEAAFRVWETEAVRLACRERRTVIDCGGGATIAPINRERLQGSGIVLALTATPAVIAARCRRDGGRPLLAVADPLPKIELLRQEREEAYAWADYSLDTSELTPEQVVSWAAGLYMEHYPQPERPVEGGREDANGKG